MSCFSSELFCVFPLDSLDILSRVTHKHIKRKDVKQRKPSQQFFCSRDFFAAVDQKKKVDQRVSREEMDPAFFSSNLKLNLCGSTVIFPILWDE